MIIELPRKLSKKKDEERIRIEDNILHLSKKEFFVKTMFWLTYELKGGRCGYCGVELKKDEITWDHIYPRNLGGPTITNNLVAACATHNNEKANMTLEEYKIFLEIKQKGTKTDMERYKQKLFKKHENMKRRRTFNLPKGWVTVWNVSDINDFEYKTKCGSGTRYRKEEKHYEKYGHLQAPVVVDKNGYLLDGFTRMLLAKNKNIKKIPVVVLENVIIM